VSGINGRGPLQRLDGLTRPQRIQLAADGLSRRAADGSVAKEAGFQIGLQTPDEDLAVYLCATIGFSGPWRSMTNRFVLYVYRTVTGSLTAGKLTEALQALVRVWRPDWAVCSPNGLYPAAQVPAVGDPLVGWLTYLRGVGRGAAAPGESWQAVNPDGKAQTPMTDIKTITYRHSDTAANPTESASMR
jgi:hypothetical protein